MSATLQMEAGEPTDPRALCRRCSGEGAVYDPEVGEIDCRDCDATGRRPCQWCPEGRAAVVVDDSEVCRACAAEALAQRARPAGVAA